MANRTDDPVGVVVDALIGAAGGRAVRAAPTAPPVMARTITAATATAGTEANRVMNA